MTIKDKHWARLVLPKAPKNATGAQRRSDIQSMEELPIDYSMNGRVTEYGAQCCAGGLLGLPLPSEKMKTGYS